jgi:tetratricopeptide (TPR) repeat protein
MSGLWHLLVSCYLPWLKFRKVPGPVDIEALELFFKKLKCLSIVKPKRFFIESMLFYRYTSRFDLNKIDGGFGLYVGASSLFSFSGISFWLSRRVLDFIRRRIDRSDFRSFIIFHFFELLHQYLIGNWQSIEALSDDLLEQNLKIGEVYWASMPLHWHGLHQLYTGDPKSARRVVERLAKIADTYENDVTRLLKYLLNTNVLLGCGRLPQAMDEIDRGIDFAQQTNAGLAMIHLLGCKAQVYIQRDDREAAEKIMEQAANTRRDLDAVPWQLSSFLKSRAAIDIYRLQEETRNGTKPGAPKYREKALRSCRAFLKQTRKVAQHRTEALRMMGEYAWLTRNPKNALKWWRASMREGERLGAGLELARTYFEIGRRLMAAGSPYKTLDGIEATIYLKKAREGFETMGLERDLDQLSRLNVP